MRGLIHTLGYRTGLSTRRAKAMRCGRIIMLHGVGDDNYSASDFEEMLAYLTKNFSVISLEQFVSRLEQKSAFEAEVALTFDDGLRNNLTVAYPLLKRYNAPATFFICPGLVTDQLWLWNHEARARLKTLSKIQLAHFVSTVETTVNPECEAIIAWMKTLPSRQRQEVQQTIRQITENFAPRPEQRQKYDLMSWDELRLLDPKLVTIGSHTVNHPILSTLRSEELDFEVSQSRAQLESRLSRKVEFFCYPNGAQNAVVAAQVRKCYRAAVTTEPAMVTPDTDPIRIPRIGVVQQPLMSWRMFRPGA